MEPARPRILNEFPTPVAYTYAFIFDLHRDASVRRWALCFTEYQTLRLIGLTLVGQYLRADLEGIDFEKDKAAQKAVENLNTAIAGIRAPFFSDWITLVETLRSRLPALRLTPLFPGLDRALKALSRREPRLFTLSGEPELAPLRAILALRNHTAHGGVPDERLAAQHVEVYLPVLHQVLEAVDFLGDCRLLALEPAGPSVESGAALVRELRGARPVPPTVRDLPIQLVDAFGESPAVMLGPDGRAEPLYPLLNPQPQDRPEDDKETIYLYDGHFGIRVEAKGEAVEKGYIHYLGVHHRLLDMPSCANLKELLARKRRLEFFLPKEKVAPWTIAETAADYSQHVTLAEMLGTKYLPECYVPFSELERQFDAFLAAKPPRVGLVLTGLAGSGKSAFLARQVERLMSPVTDGIPQDQDRRENPNLVFFVRGNGIAPREGGVSLYRDIAEKLGISTRPSEGIATFGELLDHLNEKWEGDRVEGRRLTLVVDGLNEAPEPRKVLAEALAMIEAAARFPWCKIVVSTRLEWLNLWSSRQTAQEVSPVHRASRFLFYDESRSMPGQLAEPTFTVEPLSAEQSVGVYARYQSQARAGGNYRIPACTTAWGRLQAQTRDLLANPLYLHLFMETFDGREALGVSTVPELFRRNVDQALSEHHGLGGSIEAVIGYLRADLARPTADLSDDDVNAIRAEWARTLAVEERQIRFHPVEDLAHEGWVFKRVREEGGGYRFVFQTRAEYLIYLDLRRSMPRDGDSLAYWTRRADEPVVFPEYAGSLGFLLRDWAEAGRLDLAARLAESSPLWFDDVLHGFLIERAGIEHEPGKPSLHAESAGRALSEAGGGRTALALDRAGYQLMSTHLAPEAEIYYRCSQALLEKAYEADPSDIMVSERLGRALRNLGLLLMHGGQLADAEKVLRRAVRICDTSWNANPTVVTMLGSLGAALNNLGLCLFTSGRMREAEAAIRRAATLREELFKYDPTDLRTLDGLGVTLNNLGRLLSEEGRESEAEAVLRHATSIYEGLWPQNPTDPVIAYGFASALVNLGALLREAEKWDQAEDAYDRAIRITDPLWTSDPTNLAVGYRLGSALRNKGLLVSDIGRMTEAETLCERSVGILETLHRSNPRNAWIMMGYARSLCSIRRWDEALRLVGDTLQLAPEHPHARGLYRYIVANRSRPGPEGRMGLAGDVYRRSIRVYEALWLANPDDITIGDGLGRALNDLGDLHSSEGRTGPAETAYRRSIAIYEAVWKANPDDTAIADGLGRALNNLGRLLRSIGRVGPAEDAYRRSVEIREALWQARPDDAKVGDGLGRALNNLGVLLKSDGRAGQAEATYRRSIATYEAIWNANPKDIAIGDGLGRGLSNLGNLLRDTGREALAEDDHRRSLEIREALWEANPDSIELNASYAGSLCNVGRWDEALRLVDKVLDMVPRHPYANQLESYINANRPRPCASP
jgi:tetratricopeptide (TPR) repeat protein